MALVDVSDLLVDPDFVNDMSLIHRVPTIDIYGQQSLVETQVDTIGVAEPSSGRDLERLPDALRIKDVYTFWIKAQIVADGTSAYPDLILFNTNRYEVELILDWMNWAPGWCQCVAVRAAPSL